ncbi:TrbI/VirB10 family protein [Paraburkholderia guartelaensis]|uniref:TrbI/VirB10 family protein n=1 Tax=Paraburkholderia guartelaensis TaxID=2546446 RepID=A0A4R5L331_9BURK|nr:TrbI/VirB10 family protein [Paraburkholderia guartelaensis]TDG02526.1 TrbI/VirB10 family protein [Paraburkholderia guartelaensis]
MSERNEIGSAGPADIGPQPSLDLPGRRRTRAGRLKLVLVALIVIALGASGGTIYLQRLFQQHQDAKQAALNKPKDSGASETGADLETQKARIKRAEAEQARAASDAAAAAARQQLATPAGAASRPIGEGSTTIASNRPRSPTPAERRLSGSVLVMSGDSRGADAPGESTPASSDAGGGNADTIGNGPGGDGLAGMAKSMGLAALRGGPSGAASSSGTGLDNHDAGNGKGSAFDQSLQPSKLQPMRASFRPDRRYMIARNTMIRCGQATAIRTDRPGLVGCPIADDVWSDDGTTLLIRKGALAKGEQRDAVMHGQGVIGVIWDEIDDGDVRIPLDSPATDPLGAAGIPAYIDEHFWTRFGGALVVSLIGDFGQALANKATGSGQTITFTNSSNATQDVAAETLRNSINIPPTAYSNQGTVINIFVARDVDLGSVYENVGSDGSEIAPSGRQ